MHEKSPIRLSRIIANWAQTGLRDAFKHYITATTTCQYIIYICIHLFQAYTPRVPGIVTVAISPLKASPLVQGNGLPSPANLATRIVTEHDWQIQRIVTAQSHRSMAQRLVEREQLVLGVIDDHPVLSRTRPGHDPALAEIVMHRL
jgi:hypothetical protein